MPKGGQMASGEAASRFIDERIRVLGDWRGEILSRVRRLILEAAPGIVEEWKWGVPVWSANGIVTTGETYKKAVKLTFDKGALIADPNGLFNSSLDGARRRAIDIPEGGALDETAFKALVQAAVAHNQLKKKS